MTNYELTVLARRDIRAIGQYSQKQWGKRKAIQYITALYERFDWLSKYPHLGKPRDEVKAGLFSYQENSHVVFYRVLSREKIAIIRILHHRMDFKRYL